MYELLLKNEPRLGADTSIVITSSTMPATPIEMRISELDGSNAFGPASSTIFFGADGLLQAYKLNDGNTIRHLQERYADKLEANLDENNSELKYAVRGFFMGPEGMKQHPLQWLR